MSKVHKRTPSSQEVGESVDNDIARPKVAKASLRPLPTGRGPVAIVPPAEHVQLTPVVQPVALVPYSTQEQPLFIYEDSTKEEHVKDDSPITMQQNNETASSGQVALSGSTAKRPVITYVIAALSLIVCAIMVMGDFVFKPILALANGQGIVYIGMNLLSSFSQGLLPVADSLVEASLILSFILNLVLLVTTFVFINRGVSITSKVCSFILAVLSLGAAISYHMKGSANMGIYICAAISFCIMLASFIAKRP